MRVLILPDDLYSYLLHVVKSYSGAGIDPAEGQAIFQLWSHVNQAQDVDLTSLGKVKMEKMGPGGVTLTLEPEDAPQTSDAGPRLPGAS